ncbi:hypothetical protein GCM10022198_16720 [Klugiella xanthotipulae]|uniref:Uncharacterized protein YndB with AHSA1/START domain n=1 Tax=Klugiella xanthotipulae TaxID=244735 RepID=A0A543HHC9_9MICO|nr:SRPBCC domain-containing protein [Klugiella xanthotipulae]TQM57709.1 uncharacterized protein YndB with AHSA1/START domain [Klugiella xanthotipulae]
MTMHTFTATINAPATRVWDVMLADASYREWTAAFNPGSYYTGSWNGGDTIRFLGPNDDGTVGGLLGLVTESRRGEYVSVRYLGLVERSEDDTTSEHAQAWAGATETYRFAERDGVTTLTVELNTETLPQTPELTHVMAMMADVWPPALATLTALVEATPPAS